MSYIAKDTFAMVNCMHGKYHKDLYETHVGMISWYNCYLLVSFSTLIRHAKFAPVLSPLATGTTSRDCIYCNPREPHGTATL